MSNVKLLQLKDNLTITEACDYLAGLAGVEDNNTFNCIAGLINERRLSLYLAPHVLFKSSVCSGEVEFQNSRITLVGEQKFLSVYLTGTKDSIYLSECAKVKGNFYVGDTHKHDYIYSLDKEAVQERLVNTLYENKVSVFTENLHQTTNEVSMANFYGYDFLYVKRKEIDALLESLHAKSASQTDQTKLEKQMQEKIDVLSAKIEQLENEKLELQEENKELKTLAKEPTKSVYTLTGALLKLLVDHRKPKRNQTSIVTELLELAKAENIGRLSKPNIDKFFIVAKKHLEDATDKG